MEIKKTKIEGVYIIEPEVFHDERGIFIKPFNKSTFHENRLVCEFKESFYSISKKNVIRGMHFQHPPNDHAKLIYVPNGKILDVILDIRKNSTTYGQHISIELSGENSKMVYIPKGCAHGFISLEDNSCTTYLQETERFVESEDGVHPNSFGMNWPAKNPIISTRDREFKNLKDIESPFN